MTTLKQKWYKIIFEADTKAGKDFDVALLILILLSVVVVMLDSVTGIRNRFNGLFLILEWIFTILFTLEYITRIAVHPKPFRYIFSFWGFVDLLSVLPTYLGLFVSGYHYMIVVRILRLLRMFRIFKMVRF